MKTPSPPPAPDPKATAAAQSGMNVDTARATQLTNMINQVTPDGSLTYNQTGTNSFKDSSGRTVTIPVFTARQTLSKPQQAINETNNQTELNIARIGRDQSRRIGSLLGTPLKLQSKPVDFSNDAVESRLMELGSKRLNPRFAQEEEALRTRLANQGIQVGSDAHAAAMREFSEGKNDAFNNLLLTGRSQSVNEILSARNQTNQEKLTERNQPINEISALMSGSQVSQPNFVTTPQTQVAGVDYTGMVRDKHNADMQAWQAKVNGQQAMMGGLFGLAGNIATAGIKYSDRRLKRGIEPIGTGWGGLTLYRYRYLWGDELHTGYMADEVERVKPEAVIEMPDGFKVVDYAQLRG